MHSRGAVLAVVTLAALPAVAHAQETRFGISGGVNFVGGGASKIGVDINGVPVTGASRTGQFYSAFFEQRSGNGPMALRLEAFYSRLTSGPNTSSALGQSALRDNTYGAAATMVYSLRRGPGVTPYTLLGAGMYATSLGTNVDPSSAEVTSTRNGVGLGLHLGAGLEWGLGGSSMFVEWRYQQALHQTRGAAFMPFVLGMKF